MEPINPRIQAALDQTCCMPRCLEDIIDKKVQGVALSIFEQIADFFCSLVWCGYSRLYEVKREIAAGDVPPPRPPLALPQVTGIAGTLIVLVDRTPGHVAQLLKSENDINLTIKSTPILFSDEQQQIRSLLENPPTDKRVRVGVFPNPEGTPNQYTVRLEMDSLRSEYLVDTIRPKRCQEYTNSSDSSATVFFFDGEPPQSFSNEFEDEFVLNEEQEGFQALVAILQPQEEEV